MNTGKRAEIDANIIIRILAKGDQRKEAACIAYIKRIQDGLEVVYLSEAAVTDVCFVLSNPKTYHMSHLAIREALEPIICLECIVCVDKELMLLALDCYAIYDHLDITDAFLVAYSRKHSSKILSYDTDFDSVNGVMRREPEYVG